jgi:hypothetical protein
MDVDETNFVMNASMLMGEFQKTQVIPEIDAYRYMTIAQAAIANSRAAGGYTPVVADILTKLRADIAAVQDVIGSGIPLVISMPISVLNVLENSTELTKQLNVGAFQPNVDLTYSVKKVDECPIIEVPSARMKTNFAFFDARTGGQAIGGFAPAGKAGVTIGDVRYDAAAVGTNGNAYTVTIVQGTGVSATTAGVIDSSGNLVITLGTTSGSVPLSVTAAQIAALSFSGAGAALITATALLAGTVQAVTAAKTMVGGAGAGDAAKSINWLITAANAPIAISKTNNMRIFAPDVNQTLDAWKIDYRKYHDLWILDNKLSTIFANIKESL